MFNTPILFLIFNRPDTTKQVFESIKSIKPKRLYIAADGPRPNKINETELCKQTRNIISNIDWDCDVKTLYRETNLGCKIAVSSAIDWFFENEEQGIILEDDCLPNITFYNFCEVLLEKYKHHPEIMHIGGINLQKGIQRGSGSFYFSNYNHIWGWATWKRAWINYDVDIKTCNENECKEMLQGLFSSKKERVFWENLFSGFINKKIDTWDYQWTYSIWQNNGISIIPNKNLVSNIGFNTDGTHTTGPDILGFSENKVESISTIHFPDQISIDKNADTFTYKNFINPTLFIYLCKKVIYKFRNYKQKWTK
ncbi:MAG: nucleotide-diphospho-sugar transferase [Bacteroidota bacterium]